MSCTSLDLPQRQRATFAALRDVLIPADEGMPSAGEADPTGEWANRVLIARPDLKEKLGHLLDEMTSTDIEAEVERLKREENEKFVTMALVVTGAYLMNPQIHELLGYSGQTSRPPGPDEADAYLDGGLLLDPVRQWRPRYRAQDRVTARHDD